MKLITAIIPEEHLDHVREALIAAEITRMTVSRVSGHGRQMEEDIYRGQKVMPNLMPKMRLEIAVNDAFVKITCDTIMETINKNAGQKIGNGKIFITHLEECIRIRTGESGGAAI